MMQKKAVCYRELKLAACCASVAINSKKIKGKGRLKDKYRVKGSRINQPWGKWWILL